MFSKIVKCTTLQLAKRSLTGARSSRPSYAVPDYHLPHPIWTEEYMKNIPITHEPVVTLSDKAALLAVKAARFNFDYISGYKFGKMTERKWLVRFCFLETVAGCPGFVAAILRHFQSLRKGNHDNGFIHTLLEEAENERMHLLTFMELYTPGILFRIGVIGTQGLVSNALFLAYIISPKTVHRFVGYLEEEAVRTYTHALEEIDNPTGCLHHWKTQPAPPIAVKYWQLGEGSTMRDVIAQVRADESHHRDVNHKFAHIVPKAGTVNPFQPGH